MLLREDERGVLAIGQAAHAFLSGQLARAWGNARFGELRPREEICLAAEQHDTGMAAWDLEPSFHPERGLPHDFMHTPLEVHLELWRAGPRRLVRQCRYAALLVSMHGTRLYERRDLDQMAPPDAAKVRAFLDDQRRLQAELTRTLQADPATAPHASPERIAAASDLIWFWDYLSLMLCLRWAPRAGDPVPSAGGPTRIELSREQDGTVRLDPWPFAASRLSVRCEGQRLRGRYANENELRAGLAGAPWETLTVELAPPRAARSA
jgi:hypothetical protein